MSIKVTKPGDPIKLIIDTCRLEIDDEESANPRSVSIDGTAIGFSVGTNYFVFRKTTFAAIVKEALKKGIIE